jgi:predicted esterase
MKKLLTIALLLMDVWCQGETYKVESFKSKYSGWTISYAKIVPNDYDPAKYYPLLVAEHGNGEKTWNGSTAAKVETILQDQTQVGYNLLSKNKNYQMVTIVPIAPFSPSGPTLDGGKTTQFIAGAMLNEIIDTISKRYRIDANRIYITGLSEGGADMWDFMTVSASRVAACVPISAWPPISNSLIEKQIADSKTSIWHFQSDNDSQGGDASNVGTWLSKLKSTGAITSYTVFQQDGHNMWGYVYQSVQSPTYSGNALNYVGLSAQPTNIFDWMLSKSRASTLPPIVVVPPQPIPPSGNGLKMVYSYADSSVVSGIATKCTHTFVDKLNGKIDMVYTASQPPVSGFPYQNFSLSISGFIQVPKADTYTFYVTSDDGERLSISDALVTNDWVNHAPITSQGTIQMGTTKSKINLFYYNACCDGAIKLEYSTPTVSRQLVPTEWLYTE